MLYVCKSWVFKSWVSLSAALFILPFFISGCFNTNKVEWQVIGGSETQNTKPIVGFGGSLNPVTVTESGDLQSHLSTLNKSMTNVTVGGGSFGSLGTGNTGTSTSFKLTGNVHTAN